MGRNLKSKEDLRKLPAYEIVKEEYIEELKSLGLLLEHKKSGARIVVLSNDDDNKVFSIGFRTPPTDSTGVAHIIEHTVLCGSKEFPVKDPFVELVKGSLNTFLNAMTYPDKTIYPVASCNEQDFQNLMHVYLDAVFYPNIYKKEEIFKQEGWHYELDSIDGELKYNGVVYNEMKGVFSSPEQQLYRAIQQSLFPDTSYGTESGGDPLCIPDLTYEQYLEFHRKFYHPSNSYIYLYGDMDIEEKLEWMDTHYLSSFSKIQVDSVIKKQPAFSEMKEVEDYYSVSEEEGTKEKTYLSYNVVVDTSLNKEYYLAFQILEYVLLDTPGAPLKQALLDAGIGKDILGSYDNGILQPMFSIIAKGAEDTQKEQFLTVICDTLREIIKNKLDEKALRAAINYYEFKYREADFGHYPKGLMYGIQILDSWLYDDMSPFIHIRANGTFAFLKKQIGTGYYEELIEKYLLDNIHSTLVLVKPKVNLTTEMEEEIRKKLENYKHTLSEKELEKLVEDTKNLKIYQEEPSLQEELEKIPMLKRSDMKREAMPVYNEEKQLKEIPVIHHDIYTNGIAYVRLSFDMDDLYDKAPYAALLSSVLGVMDTEHYSYLELSNEVNIYTGGILTDLNSYLEFGQEQKLKTKFEVKTKVLYENLDKAFSLINEILFSTKYRNEKRLKEIIAESKSRLQMRLNSSGHTMAAGRAMSYFSESAYFADQTDGIGYYDFLCEMEENFDTKKEEIFSVFDEMIDYIFRKSQLIISYTADKQGYEQLENNISLFVDMLEKNQKNVPKTERKLPQLNVRNEGFKTAGQIQYVARAGNFKKAGFEFHGALRVLKMIMSYDYLWNNIRVKGGAYGCMCGFGQDGDSYFVSYRDPNLVETNQVFEQAYEYVKNFTATERDMTKYIIGTISSLDSPLTPSAKGTRSFTTYLGKISMDMVQKYRDQVLNVTEEDIRSLAPIVKAILDNNDICVIGNASKIEENKELFATVKNLQ